MLGFQQRYGLPFTISFESTRVGLIEILINHPPSKQRLVLAVGFRRKLLLQDHGRCQRLLTASMRKCRLSIGREKALGRDLTAFVLLTGKVVVLHVQRILMLVWLVIVNDAVLVSFPLEVPAVV